LVFFLKNSLGYPHNTLTSPMILTKISRFWNPNLSYKIYTVGWDGHQNHLKHYLTVVKMRCNERDMTAIL
jgi:hypothetical protein